MLLDKLAVYGLELSALDWIRSYLYGRKQVVLVDGHLSEALPLEVGVPQGSILGPLFYILFTNELPNLLVGLFDQQEPQDKPKTSIVCYADDTTVSLSHVNPTLLSEFSDQCYQKVSKYMASNKLKLNSSKTHFMILRSSEKVGGTHGLQLNTGNEFIQPSSSQKLLGAHISQNLKWDQHIGSVVSILTTRLNALRTISSVANFKTRKMIADGIFISSLIYVIQL